MCGERELQSNCLQVFPTVKSSSLLFKVSRAQIRNIAEVPTATLPARSRISANLFSVQSTIRSILSKHNLTSVPLFARGDNSRSAIFPTDFGLACLVFSALFDTALLKTSSWVWSVLTFKTSVVFSVAWGYFHKFRDVVDETGARSLATETIILGTLLPKWLWSRWWGWCGDSDFLGG